MFAQFVRHSLEALDSNPTRGRAGTLTRAPPFNASRARRAIVWNRFGEERENSAPTNATTSKPDNDSSLQTSRPCRQSDTRE